MPEKHNKIFDEACVDNINIVFSKVSMKWRRREIKLFLNGMTERTETVETENGAVTRISAYYSAADLCGALEEACRLALEKIEAEGLHDPIPVTRDMFKAAFTKIVPSISAELLEEYDNFRKNK